MFAHRQAPVSRWILPLVFLAMQPLGTRAPSAQQAGRAENNAQRLVRQFVSEHSGDLAAIEIALLSGAKCVTVAATDPKDVGEACDDDENRPIRTGVPNVDEPTKEDPVYDITQALHDQSGRLIGAVGMDIKPVANGDRASALARANTLLRELEARIPSAAALRKRAS